jgi:lipoprotein-releasing system permease protein
LNFPFYIAKRYLFSKSSNNTINIITFIAAIGVVIGTLALFIVLSGFSGLREFSIGFLNTSDPDIKITSEKGKSFLFDKTFQSKIEQQNGIASYSKVIEERAFFEFHEKTHIAYIKGVDVNYTNVNSIDTTVYIGSWLNTEVPYGAVVGNGISAILSVGVFDYLEPLKIYVPKPGSGYITNPNNAFTEIHTQPIGIFALTDEIDKKYTFTSLEVAQELLNYKPEQISAIELKVTNIKERAKIIDDLNITLGTEFKIETREQLNAVFYKMLNTENLVLYFIFTLVLIIALFNIIGAIIMMILDKKNNLKTLLSLGSDIKDLKRIFVYQGFLLIVFGLIVGLLLGIILVYIQDHFSLFMINDFLAYPVAFRFKNILLVTITMLILGYLAAIIASSRINERLLE